MFVYEDHHVCPSCQEMVIMLEPILLAWLRCSRLRLLSCRFLVTILIRKAIQLRLYAVVCSCVFLLAVFSEQFQPSITLAPSFARPLKLLRGICFRSSCLFVTLCIVAALAESELSRTLTTHKSFWHSPCHPAICEI